MKKLFYFVLAFLLFNCGQESTIVINDPELITDQLLTINSTFIGEVKTYTYEELAVDVADNVLTVVSDDQNFDLRLDITEIADNMVSPLSLKMPRDFSGGPSGVIPECTYYPCMNFTVTFEEMNFVPFGVIMGSINGAHESNPEEVMVFGDFKLQVD